MISSDSKVKGSAQFTLAMIDSPGYGHQLDIDSWRKLVKGELERRFNRYISDRLLIETKYRKDVEKKVRELKMVPDCRIHCILFFFEGHHVKDQDFKSCLKFEPYTNVIPVMSKGDQFTKEEMLQVKKNIVGKA